MGFTKTEKIWMNGKLINWDDAKIHILSHVIHYGSGLFEGAAVIPLPRGRRFSVSKNIPTGFSIPARFIAWISPSPKTRSTRP